MRSIIFGLAILGAVIQPALAQVQSSSLAKIAETGTLALGIRDQSVPFSYMDDNRNAIGYSLEICKHVIESIKAKLKRPDLVVRMQPATPATRITLLANGTIDLECSTATNNLARQKQVAFSSTIFLTANAFAAKKASNLRVLNDLKGKAVSAPAGSANLQQLIELNNSKNMGMRIIPAKDMGEGFLMLETGRIAALISDDVLLASFIASSVEPNDYLISSDLIAPPEPYALMMRKDDPEFKALIDQSLKEYFAKPAAIENYNRWFLAPIPPKGINLNLPMSAGLKKAYKQPTDSIDPGAYQ